MSTQKAPSPYMPPNQAGAASAFQQGTGQIMQGGQQVAGTALPGFQQLYAGAQNNPYYAGAQGTAGQVSNLGQGIGLGEISTGQQLQSFMPGVLQTGFDPQNALYNQQYQINQEQQNAINAANGVAGSPYGAGLDMQSGQQFNLGWGAQKQARELAALQGAQSLGQGGATLQGQGLNTIQESGMLPYDTYTANQSNIAQMLNALVQGDTSAFNLTQQGVKDQGTYLGIGQTATQIADQATQINNQAVTDMWSGIGNLFGDVLGMFKFSPIKL